MLSLPEGWSPTSAGDEDIPAFEGPNGELLLAHSVPTTMTLDQLTAAIIGSIRQQSGAEPEANEPITIDGVPGGMLTYHLVLQGTRALELDAFCVAQGRAFEIIFVNRAGSEAADRSTVLGILAGFGIGGPGF